MGMGIKLGSGAGVAKLVKALGCEKYCVDTYTPASNVAYNAFNFAPSCGLSPKFVIIVDSGDASFVSGSIFPVYAWAGFKHKMGTAETIYYTGGTGYNVSSGQNSMGGRTQAVTEGYIKIYGSSGVYFIAGHTYEIISIY